MWYPVGVHRDQWSPYPGCAEAATLGFAVKRRWRFHTNKKRREGREPWRLKGRIIRPCFLIYGWQAKVKVWDPSRGSSVTGCSPGEAGHLDQLFFRANQCPQPLGQKPRVKRFLERLIDA